MSLGQGKSTQLSRRHFLRGVGACVALPVFESLSPVKLLAGEKAVKSVRNPLATTATGARTSGSTRSAARAWPS